MRKSDTNNRATENLARRASDLGRLMDQLTELNKQLLALADRKLKAIGAADLDAMCACNDEEESLLKRIREREGLRKQLMDAIGTELGMAAKAGRALSVSQLLPKLPIAVHESLTATRDRLRLVLGSLAQASRINGAVSRELIHHLEFVFSAVRPAAAVGGGQYLPDGRVRPAASRVFETVG